MRVYLGMAVALGVAACGQVNPGTPRTATSQSATGSANLNWSPVTQNTDGTILTNLAGYTVYYGVSTAALNTAVVLSDPNQTTYIVTQLTSGTWYFAVSAYTAQGVQGELSNVATKTIAAASEQ
jgi:fibronectin type III domain protein